MFFISKKKMCSEVKEAISHEFTAYQVALNALVQNEVKSFMKEYAKNYTITVWENFIKKHFVDIVCNGYYNETTQTDAGKLAVFIHNYIKDVVQEIRSRDAQMFFNSEYFIDQIVERINNKQIVK